MLENREIYNLIKLHIQDEQRVIDPQHVKLLVHVNGQKTIKKTRLLRCIYRGCQVMPFPLPVKQCGFFFQGLSLRLAFVQPAIAQGITVFSKGSPCHLLQLKANRVYYLSIIIHHHAQ